MKYLELDVINWAHERGIYEFSTAQKQALKAMSELGELADALLKGDRAGIIDGIGDVMVCLTHVAFMSGSDLYECYNSAYEEIKDRTGRMVEGGAFVKDEA